MKKVCSLFLFVLLMLACVMVVNATAGASLSGADSVTAGDTVELVLSVSDCPDVSSASVSVSYGENFELVSGTWLKTGAITHYDTEKNKGAVGGLGSPDINGNMFQLVLRAKTPSADAQPVSITTTAKNGAEEVMNATVEKRITISCASHVYDAWRVENDGGHQLVCSGCGEKSDISSHKPDAEKTDAAGQTCTICDNELTSVTDAQITTPSADTKLPVDTELPVDAERPIQETNNFPWWIVIAVSVIILCGVVLVVVKKRR